MTAVQTPRTLTAPRGAEPAGELRRIPLVELIESPWNPRKHWDPAKLAEMADSLRKGQLAPIIVRPWTNTERGDKVATPYYEIGAGHRRFRAAPAAGLTSLLAIVRDLDDVAFLELLTIENKQREDIAPLDEAAGFRLLMEKAGYDVAKLAARIGLSTKYVYDRIKLLHLIPEAKQYLENGTITAGHAILLARLTPADQKRVMGNPKTINRAYGAGSGLFEGEEADHDPDQPGLELKLPIKAVSVRELATYINDHVRFRPEDNDLPNLFPAAAAALQNAEPDDLDPVYITYDHSLRYEAKDRKVRTYGVMSWRRADGQKKSKTCAWSRIGIVAAGRDRGDAFRVCVNRDKCEVHFKTTARATKRRQAQRADGESSSQGNWIQEQARRLAQQEREEAERARWKKALPQLRLALAKAVRAASTGPTSVLGRAVLGECRPDYDQGWAKNVIPLGRTADDVVRRAGWVVLTGNLNEWRASQMVAEFKALGVDAPKIVDQVAPKPKVEKTPVKKKAKK
jgi:ParB/RepB/Spo0J family partition protein